MTETEDELDQTLIEEEPLIEDFEGSYCDFPRMDEPELEEPELEEPELEELELEEPGLEEPELEEQVIDEVETLIMGLSAADEIFAVGDALSDTLPRDLH